MMIKASYYNHEYIAFHKMCMFHERPFWPQTFIISDAFLIRQFESKANYLVSAGVVLCLGKVQYFRCISIKLKCVLCRVLVSLQLWETKERSEGLTTAYYNLIPSVKSGIHDICAETLSYFWQLVLQCRTRGRVVKAISTFRSGGGYEEENIYAKVDDMTYYPVINSQQSLQLPGVGDPATLAKHHNIINNMMVTLPHAEQMESKTLNLHQANLQKQKDFNTFNAFSTVHRSQKIYL